MTTQDLHAKLFVPNVKRAAGKIFPQLWDAWEGWQDSIPGERSPVVPVDQQSKIKGQRPSTNQQSKTKDQRLLSSADQNYSSILTSVYQSIRPASWMSTICSLFRFILPTIPKTDVLPNQMIMNGCHKIWWALAPSIKRKLQNDILY